MRGNLKRLLLLPLFSIAITSCVNNDNVSYIESSNVISTKDNYLINQYRIGKRDNDNKVFLYWWLEKETGSLCIFNYYDSKNPVEFYSIPLGKYIVITIGNETSAGYLYVYNDYYILEVGK